MPAYRPTIAFLALVTLLLALPGCETETRVLNSTWTDSFGEIADRRPEPQESLDPNDPHVRSPQGYAVEVARFSGPDASVQAFRLAADLRTEAGLGDLWQSEGSQSAIVYAGRFRDPRSDRAKGMLQVVRAAQFNGGRPFAGAQLVALSGDGGEQDIYNEHDLRNYRGRITLQIGFYDVNYGNNYRAAAETAVQVLRDQGEEAYFYHGPNRSLVTVGLFTRAQALVPNGQTEMYSPAVRALQERFPHNLMNGVTFERRENGIGGVQQSFLVPVR
ncbi:MAG: hypothetical protein ACIAXF_16350 [Phycisphaerales bacterium JB063]